MLDLVQSDLRAYVDGRSEEPFPSTHVSLASPDEESYESRLDAITVLALFIVNSGLIMAVVNSGTARSEESPGAVEAALTILWSLQAVITFLFFVVVARWLKS